MYTIHKLYIMVTRSTDNGFPDPSPPINRIPQGVFSSGLCIFNASSLYPYI